MSMLREKIKGRAEHYATGNGRASFPDTVEMGSFEQGALYGYQLACETLEHDDASHGFVNKNGESVQLRGGHVGPSLMAASVWAKWLREKLGDARGK